MEGGWEQGEGRGGGREGYIGRGGDGGREGRIGRDGGREG